MTKEVKGIILLLSPIVPFLILVVLTFISSSIYRGVPMGLEPDWSVEISQRLTLIRIGHLIFGVLLVLTCLVAVPRGIYFLVKKDSKIPRQ